MEIEQLNANSRTGPAELHGWIESAGLALGQADLVLSTDNFTLLDTPALAAVVSSNVVLRGSSQDLTATGDLEVVRARLRYDALPSTGPSTVEPWELTKDLMSSGRPKSITVPVKPIATAQPWYTQVAESLGT